MEDFGDGNSNFQFLKSEFFGIFCLRLLFVIAQFSTFKLRSLKATRKLSLSALHNGGRAPRLTTDITSADAIKRRLWCKQFEF